MKHVQSLGAKQGKLERRLLVDVRCVVVHTTGIGVIQRAEESDGRWADGFERAVWVYEHAMPASPHYVIGPGGEVVQTNRLDSAAWHTGSKNYKLLRQQWRTQSWVEKQVWYPEWRERSLYAYYRPDHIGVWKGGSVNNVSIGIEVVPKDKTGVFSEESVETLQDLFDRLQHMMVWPNGMAVYSHSVLDPIGRSRQDGTLWDPPEGPRVRRAIAETLGATAAMVMI